ncbi:MAG: L-seryl-tRNA(Sec) selenium transferase [Helicobacteraceae bacterium]|jgi:L-seryl-tRNA(Ser) seleniumtransferase|nr:L-seryl-tRNA(Sec) selenium transferase [Helicobacteraceae bacterium]
MLQNIPKLDLLLKRESLAEIPPKLRAKLAREEVEALRQKAIANEAVEADFEIAVIAAKIAEKFAKFRDPALKPLINATGVAIHTNLGRSPISPEIYREIEPVITGYSNLEFNEKSGKRGDRYARLEDLLKNALGFEAAIAVNNNAAAVFLVLNTFARDREAIVSRGELVEIGGSFRIPEVMRLSGAILREVGASNKTRLSDYENAICEKTALLMKVHKSNFATIGFTSEVEYAELSRLAVGRGLIDYYDLGSGQLAEFEFKGEPLLTEIARFAPSLVSFSGDKLFGGSQAGIICGKKPLIDALKRNQLFRMLRVGKFTIAVLEATLRRYILGLEGEIAGVNIFRADAAKLLCRAQKLAALIGDFPREIRETENFAGGGSMPCTAIKGVALVFDFGDENSEILQTKLREKGVIARVEDRKLFVETRAIFDRDLEKLAGILREVLAEVAPRGAARGNSQ